MEFTYKAYEAMLSLLKEYEYSFCKYDDYKDKNKAIILRHDVDMDLDAALVLAELEYRNNIKSTYFVLLSTDFYNIFSKKSNVIINKILNMGHSIGLHFDEVKYNCKNSNEIVRHVCDEIKILELCINREVNVVSMHRPSELILNKELKFNIDRSQSVINSYSSEFFNNFKYVSDSRMNWKEDVEKIIISNQYSKIHILTHPFWYKPIEMSCKDIMLEFIKYKRYETYSNLENNISNFNNILNESEI